MGALSKLLVAETTAGFVWATASPGTRMVAAEIGEKLKLPRGARALLGISVAIMTIKKFLAWYEFGIPNPTLRVGLYMLGQLSFPQLLASLAGCFGGALAGSTLLYVVLGKLGRTDLQAQFAAFKPTKPLTPMQVALVEAVVAVLYLVFLVYVIKHLGKPLPGILGLVAVMIVGARWTGPGMDPSVVFARAMVSGDHTWLPYYLTGSTVGGVAGGLLLKSLMTK